MSGPRIKASRYFNPELGRECGQIMVEREWGWSVPSPEEAEAIVASFGERSRLREKVEAMRTEARTRRKNDILSQELWEKEGGKIELADAVLALLAEPGEERT